MNRPLFSEQAIREIAENRIQQAMRDGEFQNLAGMGKPFPFDELAYDPHWWIRGKLRRESLAPQPPVLWRQASPTPSPSPSRATDLGPSVQDREETTP